VRTEVLDTLINSVGELFIARERLTNLLTGVQRPDLRAALDVLSARIRELHDQVMAVRMMPLRTLTERLPRLVRDLGRTLGKEAELEVVGSEIALDRAILDHLDAVFVHTLRNAVDHGIEAPSERVARGKPRAGKLTIVATRDRDSVLVVIEDDGCGLDADLLRQVALARGLISTREGEQLSVRDSYFLVCLPGFSTKAVVSDVSGRGVGMDAVRSRIESLGGTLDIESKLGHGTRFILRLPLTLAIVPVLLVEVAGVVFAIPLAKVVAIREKGADIIRQPGGATYLSFQHALVAITDLGDLLHLTPATQANEYVVVVEDGRNLAGLAVSRLVGHHEAVVKPLGDPLDRLESYSGAAILGDGHPILILDLPRALRQRPSPT
jgi:two-component system chemotaxis sensor kinase CheA